MAKTKNDPLKDVKELIDKIYSNTSVSQATTLDYMEQLKEHIESNIDALKATMQDENDLEADR